MTRTYVLAAALLLPFYAARTATPVVTDMTLSPASLAFSYQIGGAVPAAVSFAVKSTTSTALSYTLSVAQPAACSAPCVTVSANYGTTPGALKVYANPTGLAPGTYTGGITVNAPGAATATQTVNVTLTVSAAPATLSASNTNLAFAYTTGTAQLLQSATVQLSTNGDAVSGTVAASGGSWLKATPSGILALPGMPQTLTISVDATGVAPSTTPYKGTVVVTSTNAANKSVTINVTLTVSAGVPTVMAMWPPGAPAGSAIPVTVTITGANFTALSTAVSGTLPLTNVTVVSSGTLLATIPAALLATTGKVPIVIKTPSASADSTPANFTVYDPAVPQIWAVVNSASANPGVVSPGEIVTIYGAGLGPAGITQYSGSSLPTSLGVNGANTSVTIDGKAAPLLYTSPTQVSCIVPLAVAPGTASGSSVNVVVTYKGTTSAAPFPVTVAAADPGVFVLDAAGQGAILNINTSATPTDYTVNGASSPATAGSWVAIYATGFGATTCVAAGNSVCDSPPTTEAQFVGGGLVTPVGAVSVTIGGQAVTSPVGVVPVGSVIGLLQINAQVPATVASGTAVPVVVSIGGTKSAGKATMVVK